MGKHLDGFAPDVMDILQNYGWPGNVRELRNEIRRACALVEGGHRVETYHFSTQVTTGQSLVQAAVSEGDGYRSLVDAFSQRLIEETLRRCNGNRSEAARELKIDRSNLLKLIKRWDITA